MEQAGRPREEVLAIYQRATDARPSRAEALWASSKLCRLAGDHARGAVFGQAASELPLPAAGLFIETSVYQWAALDEFAVCRFWLGDHAAALRAILKAFASGAVPASDIVRLANNARFCLDGLESSEAAATAPDLFGAPAAAHALAPPRDLQVVLPHPAPRVLVAILAKQKAAVLPFYLRCIEQLDYPKSSIVIYIRTNNNTDETEAILRDWADRVRLAYAAIEFDGQDLDVAVQTFGVHEWNATRFRALAHIRDVSLGKTAAHQCGYYFTVDCDNFVLPSTLKNLVSLDLPIVAPLLRHIDTRSAYSNFHATIDDN